jgi:hypothetical protein
VDVEERFAAVVDGFAGDPSVQPPREGAPRRFGSRALRADGTIFAMVDVFGRFVVKLPAERVAELVAAGAGAPFDDGQGRVMRQWVVAAPEQDWSALAREAREFVRRV